MRLSLVVKGEKINFELKDYEIINYEFEYKVDNSRYAKGYDDYRALKAIGSLSRTIEKNEDVIQVIRNWSKEEFKDKSYYNSVNVTCTYNDEIVREITFPNAFIVEYNETIDPNTGEGKFIILFFQKIDKRKDVIINPFNDVFMDKPKTISEVNNKGNIIEALEEIFINLEIVPDSRRFF